ncbi:MAG TPA: protein kinase [Kofleriaceae bacterium]|nr:protein kinase [Kofleriaceae bacterium]
MSSCPPADVLARFVDDALPAEERLAVEVHVDECDDCRATVATMVRAAAAEKRASEPTLDTVSSPALAATELPGPEVAQLACSPLAVAAKVGRYVIAETLGVGGMGVVYAARDPELNRDLAIKVLRPELWKSDPDATRRIVREAQAMARISHPNVVAIYDVGTIDGQVFIAMERIAGTSLRKWLSAAPRSTGEILEVFIAAGRGLIAAHDAGMVHRDFKPDNVLVGTDGRTRVTDFGLAFDQGTEDALETSGETATRPIVGTPAYMAPEQHAGANLDARTDQFSFAVTLYEALYGKRPFAGKSRDELADSVINGRIDPPPPGSRVPASLRAILVRALSVKPGDRYPTLRDMLIALGRDRGRRPRQLARGALVAFAVVAVAFGADWIMRERTHAVTRTSFQSARAQLDKLLGLRTDTFVAQADALFRLPIMQEIATSRDQADFGLGDPSEDLERVQRQHETLRSADWVGLVKAPRGDVLAITDQKGRLLYASKNATLWGGDVMRIAALASAYAAHAETYIGVIDAANPEVVASGLLGGAPERKLYVAFARGKRIGVVPNAMFLQLVEAGRLLDDVGVGNDTLLSVVSADGVAEGHVPAPVLERVGEGGIGELALDDGTWLAQRTPLRARGQETAIAQLVLARQTNVGLSGLFPHAQLLLGGLAVLLAAIVVAASIVARRRGLTSTRGTDR